MIVLRGAKYIILLLGICVVLIFCGEESREFVYGFLEGNPYFLVDGKNREMYADSFGETLTKLAEEYRVGLYAQSARIGEDGLEEAFVYLNSLQKERLKDDGLYIEGEGASLLSDPVRVFVRDFREFAKSDADMPDRVYVIGSADTARKIREILVAEYNVSGVEEGIVHEETDVIAALWAIVGAVFLFLTAVDTIVSRKRGLIRAVIGCGMYRELLEGILADALGLALSFGIAYTVLGRWYIFPNRRIHVICLSVLLLGSVLIHVVLSRVDVRRALRQVQIDREVLWVLCTVKIVITVLSLVIVAGLINEIHKTKNVRDMLDTLGDMRDYHFVSVFCPDEIGKGDEFDCQDWLEKLFSENAAEYRPMYFSERGYGISDDETTRMVEISYHARDLFELTGKYRESDYASDYIVLIPRGLAGDDDEVPDEMILDACGKESVTKVWYDETAEFVCTTGGEGRLNLTVCKNPLVLLRNHPDTAASVARVMKDFSEGVMKVMFRLRSEQELRKIREVDDSRYIVTTGNVIALVEDQKHRQEVFVLSESILCGLILLYDFLLSLRLSQIDYYVNRRKNTVGLILGRSLTERYRGTILRYVITTAVSLLLICALCLYFRLSGIGAVTAFGGLLCAADIAMYLIRMRRMEKRNLKQVIAGGIYA